MTAFGLPFSVIDARRKHGSSVIVYTSCCRSASDCALPRTLQPGERSNSTLARSPWMLTEIPIELRPVPAVGEGFAISDPGFVAPAGSDPDVKLVSAEIREPIRPSGDDSTALPECESTYVPTGGRPSRTK